MGVFYTIFLHRQITRCFIILLAVFAMASSIDVWTGLLPVVSAWAANSPHVQHPSSWKKVLRTEQSVFWGFKHDHRRCRGGSIDSRLTAETAKAEATSQMAPSEMVSAENLALLSDRGREAVQRLIQYDADRHDQSHVYGDWPPPGIDDDNKRRLAEQLADLDESYPGGLPAYLSKAKVLLKESADGTNPFDQYTAVVPSGEILSYDNDDRSSTSGMTFAEAERIGLKTCSNLVFCLVAGGLGERLGYSGIKLSLSTDLCTDECYLALYARYILALQYRAREQTGNSGLQIPLVIMTSGDTDAATRALLRDQSNFGLTDDQVIVVMQDKVAALCNGNAGLALEDDDRWCIQTKPHGHGDVHHLLFREGLVDQWERDGKSHIVFLQDTNALVINSVIPTLGVSVEKGFHMNSICIPRLAGEAAGAIARLEHKTDSSKSLVINVEYNQLDPLLRTQGDCLGDVADEQTGYSPFPGNANNIIIEMSAYAKTLRGEDQGVVLEFVNPKYKDETRTTFKKPTRLECMMQDIPKLFQKEMGQDVNIGFTMFDRWVTFSPAKNSLEAGQDAVKGGNTAPGTLSSAECDLYVQNQRKLRFADVDIPVPEYSDYVPMSNIPVTPGPRIVLCPSFGVCQDDYKCKIQGLVRITERSSLVLDGHHLTIQGLELDGALVVRCGTESFVTINGLKVKNDGWELQELDPTKEYSESVRIRGYTMNKKETQEYAITEPGQFIIDASGQVKKVVQ